MADKFNLEKMLDFYRVQKSGDFEQISADKPDNAPKKEDIYEALPGLVEEMSELQSKLYAEDKRSLLIVIQAMDTAGKDGLIRHVFSGLNPQACQVVPFKKPSAFELDHDYLYRIHTALPQRGNIGIFNRSHYEEVIAAKIHNLPSTTQKLHSEELSADIWHERYNDIINFEQYLRRNGTFILKFFLKISYDEQRERLIRRIDRPDKNWKFSENDIKERKLWPEYKSAYKDAIEATSKKFAPWYVIPANSKSYARYMVANIVLNQLRQMNPQYPKTPENTLEKLEEYREILMND